MSKRSGGLITYNAREGFRSEYLAHFVFSAFGPSNPMQREDDFGLDLICNLSEQEGNMLIIKSTYGVQVKSKGAEFIFKGKQATEWLFKLEFPILFVEVSKEEFRIKIYSAWNLNRYLLALEQNDNKNYPDILKFTTEQHDGDLPSPNVEDGIIPIGHPIIDCNISDLSNPELRKKYWEILSGWLLFDNDNFKNRRAGISYSWGYTTWATNEPLSNSQRKWDKHYYYSPNQISKQREIMYNCSVILGLYFKHSKLNNDFNNLKSFAEQNLLDKFDDFGKDLFKDKL